MLLLSSQPRVGLETRFTWLVCFLFYEVKVKVTFDQGYRGKSHKSCLPVRAASTEWCRRFLPTFVRWGREETLFDSSFPLDNVTTTQPQLVLLWSKELLYLFLQVDFWHTPSLLLAGKSLLTVRGNCGNKRMKENLEDKWLYFAILHEDQQLDKTLRSNISAAARPLCYTSPTSAAYIHPMHCRSCWYYCASHKTTKRWEVLYD